MKHLFLLSTFVLLFVGCGTTSTTTPETVETEKIAKTNVNITLDAQTLTIGTDNGVELHADSDTSLHAYQWYVDGELKSENPSFYFDTPEDAKSYTITLRVKDANDQVVSKDVVITVTKPEEKPTPVIKPDGSFSSIKSLIQASQSGSLSDVTYICYGDSTRSVSEYQNQYVFEYVKSGLSDYGVHAINASVTGIKAKDAANSSFSYGNNWVDVANMIPEDGSHTIVDISLGINDYDEYPNSEITGYLRSIITSIRARKPQTHFILTVPSRVYYSPEDMSNGLISIYRSLSNELSIPMIDVPNGAMPLDQLTLDWYRSGDQTHLTQESQRKIANLILSKILP